MTKVVTAAVSAFLLLVMMITLLFAHGGISASTANASTGDGPVNLGFVTSSVPFWAVTPLTRAAALCPEITAPYLAAQIDQESQWNPRARNVRSGADGLTQFVPKTWAEFGRDGDRDGKADPHDPEDAILSQATYVCYLVDLVKKTPGLSGGSVLDLALAAYNAGPENVRKYHGIPPFAETIDYIAEIHRLATTTYGNPEPADGGGDAAGDGAAAGVIAAARAQAQNDVPYAWGGGTLQGPSRGTGQDAGVIGFDCSGLVRYAYFRGTNGRVTLPRTSREQYTATARHVVPVDQLQPGDLLFWGANPSASHHVALYVGGGRMIEAPQSGETVHETTARTSGGDFLAATRP